MSKIKLVFRFFSDDIFLNIILLLISVFLFSKITTCICALDGRFVFVKEFSSAELKDDYVVTFFDDDNDTFFEFSNSNLDEVVECVQTKEHIKSIYIPQVYTVIPQNEVNCFSLSDYSGSVLRNLQINITYGRKPKESDVDVVILPDTLNGKYNLNERYKFEFKTYDSNKPVILEFTVIGFYNRTLTIGDLSDTNSTFSGLWCQGNNNIIGYNLRGIDNSDYHINSSTLTSLFIETDGEVAGEQIADMLAHKSLVVNDIYRIDKSIYDEFIKYDRLLISQIKMTIVYFCMALSILMAMAYLNINRRKKMVKILFLLGQEYNHSIILLSIAKFVPILLGIVVGMVYYFNNSITSIDLSSVSSSQDIFSAQYWDIKYVAITIVIMLVISFLGLLPFLLTTKQSISKEVDRND